MTEAVRRAMSIKTGRLEYRFESGVVGANVLPPNRSPTKLLSFSGSNWIERDHESSTVLVNYGGYLMRYDEIRQSDGSVRRTATMSPPRSLKDPDRENRRPWFAGSFWLADQIKYVEQHRAEFRLAMPSNVDEIRCEVCEIDVPAKDMMLAFSVHTSPLLAAGGILRVHVATQLGFVLPLIEVCSPSGVKVVTYESKDLWECSDHIYFPRQIRMELRAADAVTVYEQFGIKAELVNQSIPDSDFIVKIPAGTGVRDERDPAHVRRFDLTSVSTASQLAGQDPDRPNPSATKSSEPSRNRTWPVVVILAITAACLLFAIRYRRMRS